MIAAMIAGHVGSSRPRALPLRTRTTREPDLGRALDALAEGAARYFGRQQEIDPLAALALVAPGAMDGGGTGPILTTYGQDVLLQALRLDPMLARALGRAGLDVATLFAVGTKVTDRRWVEPGGHLFADVFGHGERPADPPAPATQVLTTRYVVVGVLSAAARNTYPRQLIDRTLRIMEGRDPARSDTYACDRVLATAIKALRQAPRRSVAGWLPVSDGWTWPARPVVTCGSYRLETECPATTVTFLVRQTRRLHPDRLLTPLDDALATGDQKAITWAVDAAPEVALTWTGALRASTAWSIGSPVGGKDMHLFDDTSVVTVGGPDDLAAALDRHRAGTADGEDLALPFPPNAASGAAPDPTRGRRAGNEPVTLPVLLSDVAAPLWAVGLVRDADHDDMEDPR